MKKIEILAPAGSKESFITAVNSGADAVYCGLKDFSARNKAENFSPSELFSFTDYAHKNNVHVYVALNTLIKQSELRNAVKQINIISQAGADAVIIQDFGIADIVKNYFPDLKMHASTQMSVHNSCGVLEAEKSGFKRVVLARELSVAEIKEIKKKTSAELEIFCHGALCFGASGLCLMSSFIGGYSGNRGACAQPCRRNWNTGNKKGFYISPKDLNLSAHIREILQSGISSLKIEGRMKNAQYVYKTVKAYRALLDSAGSADAVKEAAELLSYDFARAKTTFNFVKRSKDIFSPEKPKQTGLFIGKVSNARAGYFEIKTGIQLNGNDIFKAADAKNDTYHKIAVKSLQFSQGIYLIETESSFIRDGMDIFKTSDETLAAYIKDSAQNADIPKKTLEVKEKGVSFPVFAKTASQEELFIKINDSNWMKFIQDKKIKVIFALSDENIKKTNDLNNVDYFEFPPYIDETSLPLYKETAAELTRKNKKFFLNNIAHFSLFKSGKPELYASNFLHALNSFSAAFLFKKGIKDFVFSVEDDIKNIAELSKSGLSQKGIFYISGFPVLAVSAMSLHEDLRQNETIHSQKDSFRLLRSGTKTLVLPQYPVMLFNKKQTLKKTGVGKFLIDLSFIVPDKNYLSYILDAFNGKKPLQNECEFNFDRGLK